MFIYEALSSFLKKIQGKSVVDPHEESELILESTIELPTAFAMMCFGKLVSWFSGNLQSGLVGISRRNRNCVLKSIEAIRFGQDIVGPILGIWMVVNVHLKTTAKNGRMPPTH